jgi:NADPH:quinone reductase-like Zn-dependent oxidoreductase
LRAISIDQHGGPEVMQLVDVATPEPAAGEVLIVLKAAGVGPWDWKTREASEYQDGPSLPLILGFEGAGVVEALGEGVAELNAGDEVYTYKWPGGCYAEFVAAPVAVTALKPGSLSFDEAAAVPVAGLTAHQGVIDELALEAGETVLITGAAGGVGTFATQVAAAEGARVIAQIRAQDARYVTELGASDWVDYTDAQWVESARSKAGGAGVDAVFDLIGSSTFTQACQAIRPGGRAVSIVPGAPVNDVTEGIAAHFFAGKPESTRLTRLASLFDAGKLRVEIDEVLPLEQARAGLDKVQQGHMRGKLVLRIAD